MGGGGGGEIGSAESDIGGSVLVAAQHGPIAWAWSRRRDSGALGVPGVPGIPRLSPGSMREGT